MADQTRSQDLIGLEEDERGSGFFLIPDVRSEKFGATKKIQVDGITYSDCKLRGSFAMEFKWVPQKVLSASPPGHAGECDAPCLDECLRLRCLCNRAVGHCE